MKTVILLAFLISLVNGSIGTGARRVLVGGRNKLANSSKLDELLNFSERKVNERENSSRHMKVLSITKAEQQVVSGMKYYITFKVASTDCKKFKLRDDCKLVEDPPRQTCEIEIWQQTWIPKTELVKLNCTPE